MSTKGEPHRRWRKSQWRFWDTARQSVEYCGEKIVYHSVEEAEVMVRNQEDKWDKQLRVYECPHSEGSLHYHLTSRVSY